MEKTYFFIPVEKPVESVKNSKLSTEITGFSPGILPAEIVHILYIFSYFSCQYSCYVAIFIRGNYFAFSGKKLTNLLVCPFFTPAITCASTKFL